MNNSTIDENCNWYHTTGAYATIVSYFVVTPLHLVLGLTGHCICFISFFHYAKEETAFGYQVYVAVSEALEVLAFGLYVSTFYWFYNIQEIPWAGATWFQSNYFCMWITARLALPSSDVFMTMSLLMSVAVAIDRMYALGLPLAYKNINHRRHQLIACVSCVLISVGTTVFDCYRHYLVLLPNGRYELIVDEEYMASLTATILTQLRNVVRAIGVLMLVFCNAGVVILYGKYTRKVAELTSDTTSHAKKRARQNKVLMLLAVFESTFNFCSQAVIIIYCAALYAMPSFPFCEDYLMLPLVDGLVELFDILDFYVVFAVSKQFRKMIFESVPCLKRFA